MCRFKKKLKNHCAVNNLKITFFRVSYYFHNLMIVTIMICRLVFINGLCGLEREEALHWEN